MTKPVAHPGQTVDLRPLGAVLGSGQKTLLVSTNDVQLIQLLVPAGAEIPTHEAQGEIIFHCLEGRVALTARGETYKLNAGQLVYLSTNEPFSIHGTEDASLLVTIITPKHGPNVELISD